MPLVRRRPQGKSNLPSRSEGRTVRTCPLYLEVQQLTFALEKPRSEIAHFIGRQNDASQAKYRALIEFRVIGADIGADMPEFVEVGDIGQRRAPNTRKPTS